MKILILGSTGLLGNTLTKYFLDREYFQTFASIRDYSKIKFFNKKYHEKFVYINNILDKRETEKIIKNIKPDVLINCLGLTNKKIFNSNQSEDFISINSLLPYRLQKICEDLGSRLIHFSTDCIFSGDKGFYSEKEIPDPPDIYGKSKLLGELDFENTLTIRKSVIGHELISRNGLLEWFLYQNKFVEGYKNVIFSGTTVLELAILIEKYIIPRSELKGIINITGESISKFDLLKIIADIYNKKIDIIPNELIKLDRSLDGSQFTKLTGYHPKPWPSLIKDMKEFELLSK